MMEGFKGTDEEDSLPNHLLKMVYKNYLLKTVCEKLTTENSRFKDLCGKLSTEGSV